MITLPIWLLIIVGLFGLPLLVMLLTVGYLIIKTAIIIIKTAVITLLELYKEF